MPVHPRTFLLILDGWGLGQKPEADAIRQANTPCMDDLMQRYPMSTLITHGEDVGLPDGQMGNSEVGHLNIGAGRIVWQELARINRSIREHELDKNPTLVEAIGYAKQNGKALHLLGLVSDGGVHSHIDHLLALCDIAAAQGAPKVYIHAFTDGRDCDPKSGAGFIEKLLQHIQPQPHIHLASIVGRYYAMDRDKRWERVKLAYDLLVHGQGEAVEPGKLSEAIHHSYEAGVTDEFLKPISVHYPDNQPGIIQPGDVVICFNFRTDRLRQLTSVLTQESIPEFGLMTLPGLHYVTMSRYSDSFRGIGVIYEKDDVVMTLGEFLSKNGKTQLRIAETEKYPHVTFFFSGGREEPFDKERRIMIPSPKVATYDLQPEMSAHGITEAVMKDIRENQPDFICLNFANTDMVGHTGVFSAAMKAAETVDGCLAQILPLALERDYACLIIADHGNSDYMINEDGTPNTAHTKNPVPCILVSKQLTGKEKLKNGRLADIAPTLLALLGLEKPGEMTGDNLLESGAEGK